MRVLTWVFVAFGLLGLMNVAVLYRAPGSRKANGVGVFTAWEKSKADPEVHLLVRYLVYWVAGVKVIFLALLAVIVVTGAERTKTAAGAARPPRSRCSSGGCSRSPVAPTRLGRCCLPATPGPWAS